MSKSESTATILLIDDIATLRFVLRLRLEHLGFHVLEAEDGPVGICLARLHRPVLILLDFEMPGMNGLQATEALKACPDTRDIPVILLSSVALDPPLIMRLNTAGVDAVLMKPYDFDKLKTMVFERMDSEEPFQEHTA